MVAGPRFAGYDCMDSRYDILFEPVRIGPVVAPNRFYLVPHASGMTEANPRVSQCVATDKLINLPLFRSDRLQEF